MVDAAIDPFNEGMEGKGKYYPMVVLSNKKLLLDDSFADLTIKVGNESVFAHAGIVCCRAEQIIGLPPPEDKKKGTKAKKLEVKLKTDDVASAAIMNKVLEFIYTGMVEFPKLSDKEILHLIVAARYFKLSRLTYLCERWLREHMTIESVFHLIKAANDLKEERVKGFCLQFALGHYNEFISNKDGIYILGIELFQEVVAAFQANPTPPNEMKAADHPDTLLEDLKKLYETMPYSDITFQVRGESIKCHRAVLAAHSSAFVSTIFKDEGSVRTSPEAFHNILKFTYFGDDVINPLPACELVSFSRQYKLPSLLRICEDYIRTSIDKDTVLPILSIGYMAAEGKQELEEELKKKCFPFILSHLNHVDLSLIKSSHPLMVIDLLVELQSAWKSGAYGLGKLPAGFSLPPASSSSPSSSSSSSSSDYNYVDGGGGGGGAAASSSSGSSKPASFHVTKPKSKERTLVSPSNPTTRNQGGSLLGAQRRGPATAGRGPPPPVVSRGLSTRGTSPSRGVPVTGRGSGRGLAPRSFAPPPSIPAGGAGGAPSSVAPAAPPRATPPPSLTPRSLQSSEGSDKDPASKKDKKEEERRKKEEIKRIQKEKKERLKMEKKFKPKGKEIF